MVMSQKGKKQLSYKGHIYVEEKKTTNKIYWRCKHYTSHNKVPNVLYIIIIQLYILKFDFSTFLVSRTITHERYTCVNKK